METFRTLLDFDPFNLGTAKSMANLAASFPKYNIRKIDEDHYVLEFALAGFSTQELDIRIEGDTLTVSGSVENKVDEDSYIVKGIAQRSFQRKFALNDNVVVKNADFINGILKVYLDMLVPEEKKTRKVDINTK
jgi:molecular chaperone IbpA